MSLCQRGTEAASGLRRAIGGCFAQPSGSLPSQVVIYDHGCGSSELWLLSLPSWVCFIIAQRSHTADIMCPTNILEFITELTGVSSQLAAFQIGMLTLHAK